MQVFSNRHFLIQTGAYKGEQCHEQQWASSGVVERYYLGVERKLCFGVGRLNGHYRGNI
jgi:hypothetical protein